MARILIVDDEQNIRDSLKSALTRRNHDVVTAATFSEGEKFASADFDLIFLDIKLPDGDGIDLLRKIKEKQNDQIVVMISGHADIETAIKATRLGAYDFIEKPLSLERILITVDNGTRTKNLISQNEQLSGALYGDMIGESDAINSLRANVEKSAPLTSRFLILGENGTGKELVAHMIHRHSRFPGGPFVAVNCAALPSELVEAELFGHSAGAFSGARKARKGKFVEADQGSIFLDEISEMPLEAQAKILRAVESKEISPVGSEKMIKIDCNIIAASNRNLEEMVVKNRFRQDLLYRLNVVQYNLPPLSKRTEDIPLLATHFLTRFAFETKSGQKQLSPEAKTLLSRLEFRGNIRELKNLIERLNIYSPNQMISSSDIQRLLPDSGPTRSSDLKEAISEFETDFIRAAISRNNGNMARTARELGLERSHLYKKMKKLGLTTNGKKMGEL